jgi:hypothetical protein
MRGTSRVALETMVAVTACMAIAGPASAVAPISEPYGPASAGGSVAGTYPAGTACEFAVSFSIVSGGTGQQLTFLDQNGNLVRIFNRVRPSTWVITNLDTGKSATVRIPAGAGRITPKPDGSTIVTISGGAIGFNSPTDTPPGPFALTNVGRLVFVIAPDGTGTLSLSGTATDLCALVA